jgi:NitT/TauT family transport system permease protein
VERRFWLVDLWRSASLPYHIGQLLDPIVFKIDQFLARLTAVHAGGTPRKASPTGDLLFNIVMGLISVALLIAGVRFVLSSVGLPEVGHAALLGLATLARVIFLIAISTVIWTPIGVAIGFSPRLARISQPIVQILASFPANFLFPFATLGFISLGISLNWGSILLMALGSQWYLLFNVIGGAQGIPNDLREMAASIGLKRAREWKYLIAPGIFGSWVTGAITASGGAWNASIVSELVSWGNTTLTAYGLGSYISTATSKGDWPRIVLGVGLMSVFVVGFNRLLWSRLYDLAESKYRLG